MFTLPPPHPTTTTTTTTMFVLTIQDIAVCVLLYVLHLGLKRSKKILPLPPGPPADPLLGHMRIMPSTGAENAFYRWGKEYNSDIIHVSVLGQPIIVLNSLQATVDLLEKRGAIYSDRPQFAFFDMLGWYECLLLTGYNHRSFPVHRRLMQNYFAKSNASRFDTVQTREARNLVKGITEHPERWQDYLNKYSTGIIIQLITGHEIKTLDDVYLQIASDVRTTMNSGGTAGATGVDLIPLLRFLPSWCDLSGSTSFVRKWRHAIWNIYNVPFERVQADVKAGVAQPSLMLSAMQEMDAQEEGADTLTEERIKGLCATAFAGGADTTFDTLTTFVFGIVNYPDVQERAREELDRVVGPDRMPDFADREYLPYVERVMYESFRFWPVTPLGPPHKSTEDDVYNGMFIPKGSLVLFNAFAMTHDESVYADPWRFDPDRYLPREEGGRGEPLPTVQFGFGRRVCPGRVVGETNIFIAIATMLHVLTINKAKDAAGNEITVDPETAKYTTGLTSHPETVLCNIVPTSERAKRLAMAYHVE
ncbi:cytochrome P450 [Schizophyllum amplum]|uniref:Cytochrome P450 n=1 Tax=Schizophyllum amplum TaxID=97359 RepID=A0A550CGK8_9AGAR|nr:cytochrome P450 [Auriculariopsis ampla]